jgi:hypothetical protein
MRMIAIATILASVSVVAATYDRIAVTVGTRVIAESELIQYIRCAAFLDDKAPDLSGPNKRAAAAKLVDQSLLWEDAAVTRAVLPGDADVEPFLQSIRTRYAPPAEYQNALKAAGISEAELKAHLLAGLRMLRYTDARFRPEAQISEEDLRALYNSLPERERSERSFEQSRSQLEEVLAGERVMRSLDQWLEMTRHEVGITYRDAVFQ